MTLKKFAKKTGVTEAAVRKRLERGIWQYGNHCAKGPDGKIYVIYEKHLEWLGLSDVIITPSKAQEVVKGGKKSISKRGSKSKVNPYKV